MSTVTETIPTFVDIPTTADPTNFDAEADDFLGTQLPAFVASANTWAGQVNVVAGEVNTNTVTASTAASDASASEEAAAASAIVAQGAANFVGLYSSLSGAKTAGISAEYQGAIWILNTNSADITADVPGVSSKWTRAYGGGVIYPRTSNIEFVAEDNGKIFEYTSGTFTQTFDPAATLKAGWHAYVRSTGGYVTFDPDGSETIDISFIGPGEMFLIMYDTSSSFRVIDLTPNAFKMGQTLAFESSGTFTAVKTGWHRVTVVGGGGSGALSWSDVSTQQRATGGAAGGFALKEFWAASGAAYTVTIGAGGTVPATRNTNGVTAGSAGGTSSFVGPGVSITCTGGAGGTAVNGTTATTTGAAGGTATGGDVNYTGGASGNVQNTSAGLAASGGGAVGVRATGAASGAAVAGSTYAAATGGAGTGGSSGAATSTSANSRTGGGGSTGAGTSCTNNVGGAAGAGMVSVTVAQLNSAGGDATSATSAAVSGNGGGGSGAGGTGSGVATLFAGSGAVAATNLSAMSGIPGKGGGSGAAIVYDGVAAGAYVQGRTGGGGLVIVEF